MPAISRVSSLLCCFVLTAGLAFPQPTPDRPPASGQAGATIRTSTRLVLLDVLVTDRYGKAVHGLQAQDFTILEDGELQQVKYLEEQAPDRQGSKPHVSVNLPANTYTNYMSSRESGAVNIILFDSLNTDRQNLTIARQQLLKYLANLHDNTRVALFTLDGRLHLVHGFTDDPRELVEAAERLSSYPHPSLRQARDVSADKAIAAELLTTMRHGQDIYASLVRFLGTEYDEKVESRTATTMDALDELARSVAVLPGRKNLIWISGGLPFNPASTASQMQKTAALLAATKIAVYPIDVRGVAYVGADAEGRSKEVFDPLGGEYSTTSGVAEELWKVRQNMMEMARLTGGRAYYNRNDLAAQVDEIVSSSSSYYILAYRPQNGNWDGKFRKINIKTLQHGLKVQCRPGYYAVKEPFGATDIDRTFALAMQPGMPPSTALVMQARVLPSDEPARATQIDFLLDVHDLAFLHSQDGLVKPDLMVVAAVWDGAGKPQGSVSATYKQLLNTEAMQTLMRTGLRLQQQLQLNPGTYDLRLGVVDRLSGKMGTIDMPLTIPSKVARN